ncbi:hypothetical protein EDD18DRAFT_1200713 [Armillaria luteobubalina]|uniref:Uncharacterized protein n=1 Tax=Armillaria luteobubalina TaxID=153913 RepID=A0AA39PGW3_9AGAR|nr:hypothetical protein EDD18DRAFT_1200713 [Armillaria luteobubalina]
MTSTNSTDIPQLSDGDIKFVYAVNDSYLNELVIHALMHGIYTCVLIVTLWSIFMVFMVILLYTLATIYLAFQWSFTQYAFIDHGETFWWVFVGLQSVTDRAVIFRLVGGITGCASTVIADSSMIWRCWIVWGRRWWIIVLPVLCTISGTSRIGTCSGVHKPDILPLVFDAISVYHVVADTTGDQSDSDSSPYANRIDWTMLSLSLTLTTTLLCTLLIIYRIVTVAGGKHGAGLRSYRGVVEIIVESAALYSVSTVVYMAFVARDELTGAYPNVITASIKGIAPTLIVGRVASGHARPDDSWKESVLSSLHFDTPARTVTFRDDLDLESHHTSKLPAAKEAPLQCV